MSLESASATSLRNSDSAAGVAPRALVIIPAYNEAASLPALIGMFRALPTPCDVLVIDDGSTDQTRAAVSELRSAGVRLISLPCNLGVGGAVQTGLLYALRHGYDVAVQVDGDGQHPPAEIPKLVAALRQGGGDMVIGSRFLSAEGYQSTAGRRLGIRLFSWTLSALCGQRITDATSGFRAWNHRAMERLAGEYPEDYPEVEAILLLHQSGLRIQEVPVRMAQRAAGHSTIGALQTLIFLVKVPLALLMNLIRKPRT